VTSSIAHWRRLARVCSTTSLLVLLAVPVCLPLVGPTAQATGPSLTVMPARTEAGDTVTVIGSRHPCPGEIVIRFDKLVVTRLVPEPPDATEYSAVVRVPADVTPFGHEISSWCIVNNDESGRPARATVVVMRPQLYLCAPDCTSPATGLPGDEFVLGIVEPLCEDMTVAWDGASIARVNDEGFEIETRLAVPTDATAGVHTVSTSCESKSDFASVTFEVRAAPTIGSTAPPTTASPTTASPTTASPTTASPTTSPRTSTAPTTAPSSTPPTTATTTPTPPTTTPRGGAPGRTTFAASLAAVEDLSAWKDLVATLGVVTLIVLLIGFPAEIFNSTFERHYDELTAIFARFRPPARWQRSPVLPIVVVGAIAAMLSALVEPGFGLSQQTVALTLGLFVAFIVVTVTFGLPRAWAVKRAVGHQMAFRAYPAALVIALFCALLSRAAHFQPGYVYGIVAAYAVAEQRRVHDRDDGRGVAAGAVAVLAVSLGAWLAWAPVDHYADGHTLGFPALVVDAALAAVFVAGVEAMAFQLLPMQFLDGAALRTWSRGGWRLLFGTALLGLGAVIFRLSGAASRSGDQSTPGVVPMLVLFAAFGAVSLAFWGYFRVRQALRPSLDETGRP
jgi:hypothetical protein